MAEFRDNSGICLPDSMVLIQATEQQKTITELFEHL
jgi:hypothetical protein